MHSSPFRSIDPIAAAVETHLREMQSAGYGELEIERVYEGVAITFGGVQVCGENYDIALVRLAGTLLDDYRLGEAFLERIRGSVDLAHR